VFRQTHTAERVLYPGLLNWSVLHVISSVPSQKRLAGKNVSEMTYSVSSGTWNLNSVNWTCFLTRNCLRNERIAASGPAHRCRTGGMCTAAEDALFMLALLRYVWLVILCFPLTTVMHLCLFVMGALNTQMMMMMMTSIKINPLVDESKNGHLQNRSGQNHTPMRFGHAATPEPLHHSTIQLTF